MRRIWLFIVIAVLGTSGVAQAQSCGCTDISDINYRLEEINSALTKYKSELQIIEEQGAREGKPLAYTAVRREKLQAKVQAELDALAGQRKRLPTNATGDTNNLCMVSVNEKATSCMKEAVLKHEGVHELYCKQMRPRPARRASTTTWVTPMPWQATSRRRVLPI